jgi:hypothetical protein
VSQDAYVEGLVAYLEALPEFPARPAVVARLRAGDLEWLETVRESRDDYVVRALRRDIARMPWWLRFVWSYRLKLLSR